MAENMTPTASLLRQALEAVTQAGVPDDLREIAFAKAFDLMAGNQPQAGRTPGAQAGAGAGGAGAGDALAQIGARLELDPDTVDAAFHLDDDGQVQLGVPARKLELGKAKATKQIALLLASARQAAGFEERTSVSVLRDAVTIYGKRDEANFASTIAEMDDVFNITGSGPQRRVKVNRKGFEDAGELAKVLTGA